MPRRPRWFTPLGRVLGLDWSAGGTAGVAHKYEGWNRNYVLKPLLGLKLQVTEPESGAGLAVQAYSHRRKSDGKLSHILTLQGTWVLRH